MQIAIGLAFPGELQDDAVICNLCKNFDLKVIIIEASFSMSSGWAILRIEGEENEIERAFEYLNGKGIRIEKIQTNNN
ncbi:MAG: NIL domain-containing protein [Candidatus Omnitrophica bacterium]|nr:NIL domain-containing protein [Candidatus Omnitrophota bacterium]MBU1868957.1 NIL domain-containing protein [Candidatus Omnitrophota bacterium]